MALRTLGLTLAASFLASAAPVAAVEYRVEFEGLWDGSHVVGGSLPGGAHFTTLIGATHSAGAPLWEAGTLASSGIEDVAELGFIGTLSGEISSLISAGTAGEEITVSDINSFPETTDSTFEIAAARPNVSLISMVAPSPDWFVGVSDVSLRDENGWVQSLTVDLHPYDAGTEDGSGFSLSNPPTDPLEAIALVNGAPFVGNPVIGRIHFTLITPPAQIPLLSGVGFGLLGSALMGVAAFALAKRPRVGRRLRLH